MMTPQSSPNESSPTRTISFVSLSGVLHVVAAVTIVFAATEIFKKPELPDVTEIEILSSPASQGAGGGAPPAEAAAPAQIAKSLPIAVRQDSEPTVKASPPPPPAVKAQALPAKSAAPTVAAVAKTPRHQQVAAPNFETAQLEDAPAIETPSFDEGMIADDLAKAEQENQQKTQAQVKALKAEADEQESQVAAAHAKELAKVEKQNQEEAQRMAAVATAQRSQEKLALQKAQAEEASALQAEGQAQLREAQKALNARNRAAAQAAAAAQAEQGQGEGSGNSAQAQAETGGGAGIRGIQDLQQMPGNKRPEYESDDRLQGRQGQVIFTAYVTKDGVLTDFKILKTSGHRNLDLKTLKALKQWKFFPGQEGIVEIPFQWDLKGGPQEMTTGLRTKVSQGQRPTELRNSSTESKF